MSHRYNHTFRNTSLFPFFSERPRVSPKLTRCTIEIRETRTVEITESDAAFGPVRKKKWCTESEATITENFA